MAFAEAAAAVVRGDAEAVAAALTATPGLATEQGTYDEVMECVDDDLHGDNVKMAPVVGTLLHLAAKHGEKAIARALLDAGAKVDCAEVVHWHSGGDERRMPLHLAVWGGDAEVVALLVERRADVRQSSGRQEHPARSPLEEASARGLADIARCLLAGTTADSDELNGLLIRAIQAQSKDTVELLLDARAQVNQTSSSGCSPLAAAARHRSPEIVAALLARGAQVDAENNDGSLHKTTTTALLAIASSTKATLAEWVDGVPSGPEREWRIKMQEQHLELVKVLVDSGALKVDPGGLSHCLELFRQFDLNGNGVIEKEELQRVLTELDPKWTEASIDVLMASADVNKNGFIELEEFLGWIWGGGGGDQAKEVSEIVPRAPSK